MQVKSLFTGIHNDVSNLYHNKVEEGKRTDVIVSVAMRIFGLVGMAVCAGLAIGSAVLLTMGTCGAFVPLIASVVIGILYYDLTRIGYNNSRLLTPPPAFEAIGVGFSAITAIAQGREPQYEGTLIVGPLVHCFS